MEEAAPRPLTRITTASSLSIRRVVAGVGEKKSFKLIDTPSKLTPSPGGGVRPAPCCSTQLQLRPSSLHSERIEPRQERQSRNKNPAPGNLPLAPLHASWGG